MQHLDLNTVRTFVKVVEFGSFTRAAAALHQPKSRVSRAVAALERDLHVQLLYRTTRQLRLTAAGQQFYRTCSELVVGFEGATESLQAHSTEIAGLIRLTGLVDMGTLLVNPIAREFTNLYPKVRMELYYTDDVVDLVREGFDLAIRVGAMSDSRLRARKIGEIVFVLVASPQYLALKGIPAQPRDLDDHVTMHFTNLVEPTWRLTRGRSRVEVKLDPAFASNNIDALIELAIAGKGIAYLPAFAVRTAIQRGELMPVLKDWTSERGPVYIVTPGHKESSARVKAFADFALPRLAAKLS